MKLILLTVSILICISVVDHDLVYGQTPGTEKWSFFTGHHSYSCPAIGADGTIYVGSMDFHLYAINPDGTEKWQFNAGDAVRSHPSIGSDGTIYVGSDHCYLYAIYSDSYGLASSSWPKYHHDEWNTGCLCDYRVLLSLETLVLLLIFITVSMTLGFRQAL